MASRRFLLRSRHSWMVRVPLAVVAAVVGCLVLMSTYAAVISKADPERAHRLAPENGRITAELAEKTMQKHPTGVSDSAIALARMAMRQDATAVKAVITLMLEMQLSGDARAARRLADYSLFLSRRELQTQLWMIENAVARGDVAGALHHYDIALRTSRSSSGILFPVLSQAVAQPPVRSQLIVTLSQQPAWGPAFLAYALGSENDPRHLASLFVGLRRAGVPVSPEASASLVNRLLLVNAPDDAWRYYALVHGRIDRRRSRDPRFRQAPGARSLFDWNTSDVDGAAVSFQRGGSGGIVDFFVPAGRDGVLLSQMQFLPPGRYRLSGEAQGIDQASASRPYWTLMCRNAAELGRISVPAAPDGRSAFLGHFDVPSGCSLQTLALVARPTEKISGVTGQISRAELAPDG